MPEYPDLAELLPLAGRAILLDKIVTEGAKGVTTLARITSEHPFYSVELGGVPSWVGIELMAQTIGLHAGLVAQREHRLPRVGYLLGTRRYVPAVPFFQEDTELVIAAEKLYSDAAGLGAYACIIESSGKLLVNATVIVYQGKEDANT
ncbi:3-hydroxylacyl-(acyl carrier protein) dehydratase, predicted [mine drainage metagenome]|uniref:3-hydroxylacyl-(Acyl carrier protein) dehydratase, predicted n=1 Tax=mine drainage metagenome TaxID=410659 RepID=T1BI78_9ZZZZ